MKLLNRNYRAPTRMIGALGAYALTFIATGRGRLAQELAGRCWSHNDFKLAMRRGAWYFRRSWFALDVAQDDFFDPTEGMNDAELGALEGFVCARQHKLSAAMVATDKAFIAARRLDNNEALALRAAHIDAFTQACNVLLAQSIPPQTDKSTKSRVGDFPVENAKQTLADFITLFPQDKLRWFLVSGTFLGLIRENGFLKHDYDIDLGVFEDEIDIASVKKTLGESDRFVLKKYDHHKSSLFEPEVACNNPDVPYILKIIHMSGIHIDLFIHYRDTQVSPPSYWHGSSLHRWNNSPFELKTYRFYDHDVLAPAQADLYLTENYGDWRTPVTDFDCTTGTPNLALVPHPIAVVIFLSRYMRARTSDPKAAYQLKQELLHNGFLDQPPDGPLCFSAALFAQPAKD